MLQPQPTGGPQLLPKLKHEPVGVGIPWVAELARLPRQHWRPVAPLEGEDRVESQLRHKKLPLRLVRAAPERHLQKRQRLPTVPPTKRPLGPLLRSKLAPHQPLLLSRRPRPLLATGLVDRLAQTVPQHLVKFPQLQRNSPLPRPNQLQPVHQCPVQNLNLLRRPLSRPRRARYLDLFRRTGWQARTLQYVADHEEVARKALQRRVEVLKKLERAPPELPPKL